MLRDQVEGQRGSGGAQHRNRVEARDPVGVMKALEKSGEKPQREQFEERANDAGMHKAVGIGCQRAPWMNEDGSKTSEPATVPSRRTTRKLAINSTKYAARLMRISRRVAPLKSGKANGLEPNLGIAVNRVNARAGQCHGSSGRLWCTAAKCEGATAVCTLGRDAANSRRREMHRLMGKSRRDFSGKENGGCRLHLFGLLT